MEVKLDNVSVFKVNNESFQTRIRINFNQVIVDYTKKFWLLIARLNLESDLSPMMNKADDMFVVKSFPPSLFDNNYF